MQKINNRKNSSGPWDYPGTRTKFGTGLRFHDCHICQGMKQGRGNTVEDLSKLFIEAEKTTVALKTNN